VITITRKLARRVRAVFRRALSVSSRDAGPAALFSAGPDGISVRARSRNAAAELRRPGSHSPEELRAPWQLLVDCEGTRDEPVAIEPESGGGIVARWNEDGIPQVRQYGVPEPDEENHFPAVPEKMRANGSELLEALREAARTADPLATRYALGCLQLQGRAGRIAATDGSQLLVQSGLTFPWKDNLLVPASDVFASRELPREEPVEIGRAGDWVAIRSGPWTFWLAIEKEARFPQVESQIADPRHAVARVRLAPADAGFLVKALPRLPGNDDLHSSVTLELNGRLAVRAKAEDQPQPTELVLSDSECTGEAICTSINRKYLARAIALGFRELCLYGPEDPLLCDDGQRSYVWVGLGSQSVIPPSADAVRIEAPTGEPTSKQTRPSERRTRTKMPRTRTSPNGQSETKSTETSDPEGTASLLEQAEALKAVLQDALGKTRELIQTVKREEKRSRIVQNTLASLRQLQTVDM
jgi:hypothetical protein